MSFLIINKDSQVKVSDINDSYNIVEYIGIRPHYWIVEEPNYIKEGLEEMIDE